MHTRTKTVLALGTLAVALACNDKQFLTEQPFDFIGPSNFYRNAGDAVAAVNGVYADFVNSTGDNYYGRNFVMLVEFPTEMWTVAVALAPAGSVTFSRASYSSALE